MRDGEQIRIIGSGGAPALITVGNPFELPEIKAKLGSGEWLLVKAQPAPADPASATTERAPADEQPSTGTPPEAADGIGKPPQSAPKADWVDHIVRSRLLSREDAETYTKADLIDMVS